jgi:hypothetical protein
MILDAQNLFSDAQAITAAAASTNLIDLGANRNLGVGEDLYVHVNVDVAFTDASSDSTLTVTVETDDNEAFSSPTTAQTIGTFPALSAIGASLKAKLQPDAIVERYMRLKYTPNNGSLSTGSVTAALVLGIQAYTSYADNVSIQ